MKWVLNKAWGGHDVGEEPNECLTRACGLCVGSPGRDGFIFQFWRRPLMPPPPPPPWFPASYRALTLKGARGGNKYHLTTGSMGFVLRPLTKIKRVLSDPWIQNQSLSLKIKSERTVRYFRWEVKQILTETSVADPDPVPLVRGMYMDPDPDPPITKQK